MSNPRYQLLKDFMAERAYECTGDANVFNNKTQLCTSGAQINRTFEL